MALVLVSPVLKTSPAMAGATFTVNSTADDADSYLPDGICDTKNYPLSDPPIPPSGICTLRAAIQQANYNTDSDVINFNIPGLGFHTITPQTFLPNITAPLSIWGGSQPGYAGQPLIELNGTLVSANNPGATGLVIFAPDSAVGGMIINSFGGVGILLLSGSNKVYANYIGTDVTGTLPRGNGLDGVRIQDSTNNEIGGAVGPNGFPSNVISGNGETGIRIEGQGATGNKVFGNYIGTSANGKEKIPNGWDGVHIHNAPFNFIGMDFNNTRNVISGNTQNGVRIMVSGSTGNMVRGNYIGTDVNGLDPLGNTQNGVHIVAGASNNTIGGTSLYAERNIISGNGQNGILVTAEPFMEYMGKPTGNIIKGNRIGTNASGDGAVFNGEYGVHISAASGNVIGVPEFGAGNTISGNTFSGIHITGSDAQTNVVQNNLIGTNSSGSAAIANLDGVSISQGASGNTIGGTGSFMGNTIAGNAKNGIKIYKLPVIGTAPTNNYVHGNYIGVNNNGNKVANKDYGVIIESSPANFIGGAGIGAGNTISGNGVDGILIKGSGATGNVVQRNFIGTNSSNIKLGNGGNGVAIENVPDNLIGGTAADVGNVISDNAFSGVHISGSGATGNLVQGNKIGTNNTGTAPLGNFLGGVSVTTGASNNIIGGIEPGAGNTISGNKNGVHIYKLLLGGAPAGNKVQGNYIGTNSASATGLGNTEHGVFVDSSPANLIGGTVSLAQNIISGNTRDGIHIQGAGATGNLVQGNRIGTNAAGDAKLGNMEYGVSIDGVPDNIIGGTEDSARNVISGNGFSGVYIAGSGATGNLVKGNYIGANAAGTGALGNTLDGVSITSEASNNTIGGPTFISRNIISGNGKNGIKIHKPLLLSGAPASNKVLNNYIGTDKDGNAKLGNTENGVLIESSATNIIGGDDGISRNIISGNVQHGVMITGSGANGNLVQSNYIGTNASSATNLGNTKSGVYIGGGSNNIIGGTIAFARNVISSNGENGVAIVKAPAAETAPTANKVQGNYIGTDITGMLDRGNTLNGIFIENAASNIIEGPVADSRNIISGNDMNGILISGSGATGNQVMNNFIGIKVSGKGSLDNVLAGVRIELAATDNIIGGGAEAARNVISRNQDGVTISGAGTTGNKVLGNYIGLDASGGANINDSINMGNAVYGVRIVNGASGNHIGGTMVGEGNRISGNGWSGILVQADANFIKGNSIGLDGITGNIKHGIHVLGANNIIGGTEIGAKNIISRNTLSGIKIEGGLASLNQVVGNFIGTGSSGASVAGNQEKGVLIEGAAHDNVVGGTTETARNIISGNGQDGVVISGDISTFGNKVQGNYIGTDVTGVFDRGNTFSGVKILGAVANIIGGTESGAGNIISGNNNYGIVIEGAISYPTPPPGNIVQGNYVGLDKLSTVLPNEFDGIYILGSKNNTIGGTVPAARNVVSGNKGNGIQIQSVVILLAAGNIVQGNYIGTDATGTLDMGNKLNGVFVNDSFLNTVGGTTDSARNIISGNDNNGVHIKDGPEIGSASDNKVQGNYIGTKVNGIEELGNTLSGVRLENAPTNTIGGTEAGARNIISGNAGNGVTISGSGATGNLVQGNYIGVKPDGFTGLGNLWGVYIQGASNNVVGGADEVARNIISKNGHGVAIHGPDATGNKVQGNYIGVDSNGGFAVGNILDGVSIANASSNTIGGTSPLARNVISGNANGVVIGGNSDNNLILGNYIGTDKTGASSIWNIHNGVFIIAVSNPSTNNSIGGQGASNVISGNKEHGIRIQGNGASGTWVLGNNIGVKANASGGNAKLGNEKSGVFIDGAPNNNIGDGTVTGSNTIGGNWENGIAISGLGATGNKVQGNFIGTDSSTVNNLGNINNGILTEADASATTVGGMSGELAAGNTIAFNGDAGVRVVGSGVTFAASYGIEISKNSIFSNGALGVDIDVVGVTPNDASDLDYGGNSRQNFPVLTTAEKKTATLNIKGSLGSAPLKSYRIEFFSSPTGDTSGYGEGKTFVGQYALATDSTGQASFDLNFPLNSVLAGHYITSTATDVTTKDTSEFSQGIQVTVAPVQFQVYWTDYTPSPIRPGEALTVPLTIQNTGSLTWPKGGNNPVYVSYHWVNTPDGQIVVWDGLRTSLPSDMAKDEMVNISAKLKAPTSPGTYTLRWDMLQEGVAWFSTNEASTLDKSITVAATKTLDVQWAAHSTPSSIKPGQQVTVPLTITNTGSQTWTKNPVYVSYHWFNASTGAVVVWDGLRSALPNNVATGESVNVSATLKAPSAAGNYTLKWNMIEESVAWFSSGGAPTLDVDVSVAASQAKDVQWVSHDTPTTIKPGQMVGVPITLTNTGSQTWPKGGANPVYVTYHWYNASWQPVEWGIGLRSSFANDVASGQTVSITAVLKAPSAAGSYNLFWDVVQESVAWFSGQGAPLIAVSGIAVAASQAKDLQWVSHDTPTSIKPGQMVGVPITLTNTGSQTWPKGGTNPVYVTYHWYNASWQPVEWGIGLRSSFAQEVPSGQMVGITASLKAPAAAGTYNLLWDVVHEGVAWFSGQGAPLIVVSGITVASSQTRDVQWVSHNTPASMAANQQVDVSITLTNTGSQTWPKGGANPVNLSYHWLNASNGALVTWDGERTPLAADVTRGQMVTLNATLKAPSTAGTYDLVWDMIHEGITWFSTSGAPSLYVPGITVDP